MIDILITAQRHGALQRILKLMLPLRGHDRMAKLKQQHNLWRGTRRIRASRSVSSGDQLYTLIELQPLQVARAQM
jgi:hypothetical protein